MFRQKVLADPTASFARKTVLITGANSGLGLEAATKFAALGASKLILACRDRDRGEAAKALIKQRTGNKSLQVWPLDMNSYDSVRGFARRAREELECLDVAVLNAGVYKAGYEQSYYGWEETLQVNVISTSLLSMLLLPKLRSSSTKDAPSVLELVSSRRAEKITLNEFQLLHAHLLKTFNDRSEFKSSQQYQLSKFFLFAVVKRLAEIVTKYSRASDTPDVIVTSVCPGFCRSNLSREQTGVLASITRGLLNSIALRTAEEGSRSLVSGTLQTTLAHGKMWHDDKLGDLPIQSSQIQADFDIGEKVFDEVLEALEPDAPELDDVLTSLKG